MKLLVVDDEKLIRDVIREYAESESFKVLEACDGENAISVIEKNPDVD